MTVSYQRRRRRIAVLLVISLLVIGLAAGFFLARQALYSGMGIDPGEYRTLRADLPAAREQINALEGELEVLRTRHEVDRTSLEIVRREIASQKEQAADLEEALQFYRSLMAPGEIAQKLSLREIELVAREAPRRYAYRIVVQQEARKHDLLRGELYAEVFGVQADEQVSYPLAKLSEDLDSSVLPLRFRYFQSIEGELVLPEGFEPAGVSIVASVSEPRKEEAREKFPWLVKGKFTHVGN